jgi:adenylate cyclase
MPPTPWLIRNPSIERPFVGKDVPLASDSQRANIERLYPPAGKPKALALAPDGFGFYYYNTASAEEAIRRALESCGHSAGVACMILAVDDLFVVPVPLKMKATGFFLAGSNVAVAPELRESLMRRLGNATNAWNAIAVGANGRPGLVLNAADEDAAIEGALTDCGRQDRNCHVIALGPFSVEPLPPPKQVEQTPSPQR